jgi:hypothetical protein
MTATTATPTVRRPLRWHRALARPWAVTALAVLGTALAAAASRPPSSRPDPLWLALSAVAGVLFWWTLGALVDRVRSEAWRLALGVFVALFTVLLLFSSALLYAEFGEFHSADMLHFVAADPPYFVNHLQTYVRGWALALFVGLAASLSAWWWRARPARPRRARAWLPAAALVVLIGAAVPLSPGALLLPEAALLRAAARFARDALEHRATLRASERLPVAPLARPSEYDVLVVVNESWSREHLAFYEPEAADPAMPFLGAWLARAGERAFVFRRAFTSATATDVSVPSLLTGTAPDAPAARLHEAPLLWDWGKAAGMTTMLVSPQRYAWARFDAFFFGPSLDFYRTAESIDAPIVNDCGIDEIVAADAFAELVARAPAGPLLAVYNSNALHAPFQAESERLGRPPRAGDRYRAALDVLDAALARLLGALERAGRLERTIVVVTSDHGRDTPSRPVTRVANFYDDVARIPLVVVVPPALAASRARDLEILRRNGDATVGNLDVVPTVVDLLGLASAPANARVLARLDGQSLLAPVEADRALVACSTNDVRRWEHEGFGIYWGDRRLVASTVEGIRLFDVAADPDQRRDLWPVAPRADRERVERVIDASWHLDRIRRRILALRPAR